MTTVRTQIGTVESARRMRFEPTGDIASTDVQKAIEEVASEASPNAAEYIVATANSDLTSERVVTDTTSITWDNATAGQAKAKRAALTGDVTASADDNATTIANNAVSNAKLRDSGGLSVVGRSANSSGDPADISAVAASDAVLRESGSVVGFGTIATGGIANDAVTFAKVQNIATDSLIGRDTAATGDPENILLNATLEMDGSGNLRRAALTGDVTAPTGSNATTIANDAVTNAKAANMAQSTVKGRAAGAGTGDPTDLTGTQTTAILDAVVGDSGSGGTKGLAPAPGAGDAAAGKFLKADGTYAVPPGSVSSKVVNTTYDLTTASGTQDVTGFGFNPTSVAINFCVNAGGGGGVGYATAAAQGCSALSSDNGLVWVRQSGNAIIYTNAAVSAFQTGTVTFITDGIRITWGKTGSPTGTLGISVLGQK